MMEQKAGSLVLKSLLLFCLPALLLGGCSRIRLEKKLGPDDADFYSKARYVMTREEAKIFLELPREEREQFKKDFWKRRDPDPETEDNEVERDYYDRIEEANGLFRTEGKEGWLTDRGRIYILFGPPLDRIQFPQGGDPYNRSREIWYYGNFPVVFIDSSSTGIYELVTYDLTGLRTSNLIYMHLLNLAQIDAQKDSSGAGTGLFDFSWKVNKKATADRVTGEVLVTVPYRMIWFEETRGRFRATLSVELELVSGTGQVIWEHTQSYGLELTDDSIPKEKKFQMTVPFDLVSELDTLRSGGNKIYITLTNKADGSTGKKVMDFKL
jgi:GWxTD domain-containing protein